MLRGDRWTAFLLGISVTGALAYYFLSEPIVAGGLAVIGALCALELYFT